VSQEQLSELGQAALAYAAAGFAVFPVRPRSKIPRPDHGFKEWTKDPERIKRHWLAFPDDNIGITCGTPSNGLLVIDLDVKENVSGIETLKEWERAHGEFDETAVSITGSGGRHYLFMTDRQMRQTTNSTLGVDTRIDGYIVAPPSIHKNGSRYEWWCSPFDVDVAEADGNVYDFIDYITRNGGTDANTKKANGKFQLPDIIKKGERDETLFKYACHLRAIGRSDEEIALSVAGVNATRCKPPVEQSDINRIVRSACKYEQGSGEKPDDGRVPKTPAGASSGISCPRGPRGAIMTGKLAELVMKHNHACIIDGAPAVWTGKRWSFSTRAINRCTLAIAPDAKKQDKSEVMSYIMDAAQTVSSDKAFDGHYYVQFANCTYDVMDECVVDPDPRMFIVGTLPVNLNFDAERNLADEFLESISAGDPATLEAMVEYIGACMCSRRVLSQAIMLIGTAGGAQGKASNGKSTYMNWIRAVVGGENVSSLDISTLGQRFQAGRLVGKLANLGDDIPDGFLKGAELSMFKKLVTGDAIYTDVKNGEGFEFRSTATLGFSMNIIPRFSDTTDGIYRRLYFVPFRAHFAPGEPGYDPDLARKLAAPDVLERAALLGLQGLHDLIERGHLPEIPDMVAEMDEIRQSNDSVLRWLVDYGYTAETLHGYALASMYKDYRDWCEDAGERSPYARRTWTQKTLEAATLGNATDGKTLGIQSRMNDRTGKKERTFVLS
jgi:P4 family phage/plasmid primase-like protien